jgi:CrcB protein
MIKTLIPIALGGAIGALARYGASLGIHSLTGLGFPYGTLFVNVIGSFSIGALYVVISHSSAELGSYRALLIVGLLGAFTTFSTFSIETVLLIEGGHLLKAALNVSLSVLTCLIACSAGLTLARGQL